jgi:hypothetical protein
MMKRASKMLVRRWSAGITAAALAIAAVSACGPNPKQSGGTLGPTQCGAETRQQIDCSSEISYQGINTAGGLSVANLGGGHAKYEETALRRVDEQTERFFAMQSRLCRDYNACVLDKDSYVRQKNEILDRIFEVPKLGEQIKNAKSEDERSKLLDALYRKTVPADQRPEEVTFTLALEADLPNGQHINVLPGASLPTDTRVAFNVGVSAEAWVYIFQKAPNGGLTVLFPNDKIGTKNPLPANVSARIPSGTNRFRLNDKDIGTEKIYIAVSRSEITKLSDAMSRVNAGQITSIAGDGTLQSIGNVDDSGGPTKTCSRGLELDAAPPPTGGCTKSRGLELDGGDSGAPATTAPSLAARTEPGDSMIVKVFSFEHLTAEQFAAKGNKVGGAPSRSRGAVIEEQ